MINVAILLETNWNLLNISSECMQRKTIKYTRNKQHFRNAYIHTYQSKLSERQKKNLKPKTAYIYSIQSAGWLIWFSGISICMGHLLPKTIFCTEFKAFNYKMLYFQFIHFDFSDISEDVLLVILFYFYDFCRQMFC